MYRFFIAKSHGEMYKESFLPIGWRKRAHGVTLTLSYSSEINASEGLFALEKNTVVCAQSAIQPIQTGATARCILKWLFCALF